MNLGSNINDGDRQIHVSISSDDLVLFFSNRLVGDISISTCVSKNDEWGPKILLDPAVNGPSWEASSEISPNGSTSYFDSGRPGGLNNDDNFWQVKFIPILDFSGNGIVDSTNMCIMVDNWHTNNTVFDIAPLPLGDNFVDI